VTDKNCEIPESVRIIVCWAEFKLETSIRGWWRSGLLTWVGVGNWIQYPLNKYLKPYPKSITNQMCARNN